MQSSASVKLLSQAEATQMDVELMGKEEGFSVDQLMELAGLAVAQAVVAEWSPSSLGKSKPRVLVACGPGNNGGDGLVAARHLHHMGYAVQVLYPRRKDVDIYNRLSLQLQRLHVPFVSEFDKSSSSSFDILIDAIFGYSFQGDMRAPFDALIKDLIAAKFPHVCAVDIPSGWDVERGDVRGLNWNTHMLVSLTAPKLCAQHFHGVHYLGGRFVPDDMAKRYQLNLPEYPGSSQVAKL